MSKSKHSEAQIIGALKQVEAGRAVEDLAREYGVSSYTRECLTLEVDTSMPSRRVTRALAQIIETRGARLRFGVTTGLK